MTVSLMTAPHRVGVGPGLAGSWGWLAAGLAVTLIVVVAVWASRRRRR